MKSITKPTLTRLAAVALLLNSSSHNEVRAIGLRSEVANKIQLMVANDDKTNSVANSNTEVKTDKVDQVTPVHAPVTTEEVKKDTKEADTKSEAPDTN